MKQTFFFCILAFSLSFAITGCDAVNDLVEETVDSIVPNEEKVLEESAVPIVNKIIWKNTNGSANAPRCTRVERKESIQVNKWRARAFLDNGSFFNCVITRKDDMIYVQIVQ